MCVSDEQYASVPTCVSVSCVWSSRYRWMCVWTRPRVGVRTLYLDWCVLQSPGTSRGLRVTWDRGSVRKVPNLGEPPFLN